MGFNEYNNGMKNILITIFIIALALVAITLYKSSESFPKPLEKKELLENQEAP